MDIEKIRSEYKDGKSLRTISEELGIELETLRKICYKGHWKHGEEDRFYTVKKSADTVARLIGRVSAANEEKLSNGGTVDARDIKYLTSAQKEILEVMRDVYELPTLKERTESALEREKFIRAGEKNTPPEISGGVVLIPEVEI